MANVVRRVVIEKLYDNYDYDISFHKGGVTLITGPNGYGKTTVLNIIKNALELEFLYFYELLFKSIILYFDDKENGPRLLLKKVKVEQELLSDEDEEYDVEISFYNGDVKKATDSFIINKKFLRHTRSILRQKYVVDSDVSFFDDVDEDMRRYHLNRCSLEIRRNFNNLQLFLNDKNCLYIKEQRILSSKRSEYDDEKFTIQQLAEDLKKRYAAHKSQYTDQGQIIDSTFIQRLLSKDLRVYNEEGYHKRINELNKYVEDYKQFGLISNFEFIGEYRDEFKAALTLYIDDMFSKIAVYDAFFRQLSSFHRFVNGKGLSNKAMILDEKDGISFISDSGRKVPLHKLSSGEQNLIILYYRLVFETVPNTLLLIDEPENSLHVEWLEKMLMDYLVMEGELKCQMVIATHSPIFIGDNFNIAYDLCGGSYQEWMK